MRDGRNRQNWPILLCGHRGRVLQPPPNPAPDRTCPNPTKIVLCVPIPPRGPPRGMKLPPGAPNCKTGKNSLDLTHFSAFKPPGGYPHIPMPPPGWSRRTKWNRNPRRRS